MKPAASYDAMCAQQRWRIPERFNMGVAVCDKQKQRDVALIHPLGGDEVREYTFGDLKRLSNRLANVLVANGINRGDRVGILLPQTPETATAGANRGLRCGPGDDHTPPVPWTSMTTVACDRSIVWLWRCHPM